MSGMDPRALRNAFGSFMTGVTVVTARSATGDPVGFTANSFTSVSLDPPLLLVCPGKSLSSYQTFAACTHFAVNVLAEGQEAISNRFAGFKGDRFADLAFRTDARDLPRIDGAVAQFSCATRQFIPAGDHAVLIGEVLEFQHIGGRGLGYAGGQYFSLGLERSALEQGGGHAVCGAVVEQGNRVLLEQTTEGYQPLQITRPDRGRMRQSLTVAIAERGLPIRLGRAYSIFDQGDVRHVYFLAATEAATMPDSVHAVPLSELPTLRYASQPIADMMTRFAIEAQHRRFSLYLGDAESGDTDLPMTRT